MSDEAIKCLHCNAEPHFTKHIFSQSNSVYYNFTCFCKETPLRRSFIIAEGEWERNFYKREKKDMPAVKDKNGNYLI